MPAIARGQVVGSRESIAQSSIRSRPISSRGISRAISSRAAIAPRAQMQSKVSWDAAPWAGGGRPGPPDIYGIGMNFLSHAKELGKDPPVAPLVFPKATSSFNTGRYLVLPDPAVEPKVDYEVELGVVIGPEPCRNVSEADAMKHVFGYVVAHDVSGRYSQFEAPMGNQWSIAKSFDTFSSVQDEITPSGNIDDPHALGLKMTINGKLVQEGNTSDLIFNIPKIISYLSRSTTLLPGTLIMTGTPPGPGHFKDPPVYLQPGDSLLLEVEGVGTLSQEVVAADDARIEMP